MYQRDVLASAAEWRRLSSSSSSRRVSPLRHCVLVARGDVGRKTAGNVVKHFGVKLVDEVEIAPGVVQIGWGGWGW